MNRRNPSQRDQRSRGLRTGLRKIGKFGKDASVLLLVYENIGAQKFIYADVRDMLLSRYNIDFSQSTLGAWAREGWLDVERIIPEPRPKKPTIPKTKSIMKHHIGIVRDMVNSGFSTEDIATLLRRDFEDIQKIAGYIENVDEWQKQVGQSEKPKTVYQISKGTREQIDAILRGEKLVRKRYMTQTREYMGDWEKPWESGRR